MKSALKRVSFVTLLALGMFCSFSWETSETAKPKSVDEYWAETHLRLSELEELIETSSCSSSERYFLSCANAVANLAQRFGLQVLPPQKIVKEITATSWESEKASLRPWLEYFRNSSPSEVAKISFVQLLKEVLLYRSLRGTPVSDSFLAGVGINGFLSVFKDPHTYILPEAYYEEVISQSRALGNSLGFHLAYHQGRFYVRKVLDTSIAQQAGVKRGDILVTLQGDPVAQRSPGQVFDQLRSLRTGNIKLEFMRNGKTKEVTLARQFSRLPTVTLKLHSQNSRVGVLSLHKFSRQTCREVRDKIQSAQRNSQKLRGLILDLRDNPGGPVESAACVASLFLGPRKMFDLRFEDSLRDSETYQGNEKKIFSSALAVVVNSGTASAAELLAGILQDYGRAVVVGEKTFGKGSFQEGETWVKNDRIFLFETKGLFYLPSGKTPQLTGIKPDVQVTSNLWSEAREGEQFLFPLAQFDQSQNTEASVLPAVSNLVQTHQFCLNSEKTRGEVDSEVDEARKILHCLGHSQEAIEASRDGN